MRAQLRLGLERAFADRSRKVVFARVAAIAAALLIAWLGGCVFLILEPLP